MAKKTMDRDLFDTLRSRGLRKRVAKTVAQAAGEARDGKMPKVVRDTVTDLRSLLDELEDKARGGPARRSQAGKKAARTRQRKATQRSQAAKRAARTRARSA